MNNPKKIVAWDLGAEMPDHRLHALTPEEEDSIREQMAAPAIAPELSASMSTSEALAFAQAMGGDEEDDEDFDGPPVVPELLANMSPDERARIAAMGRPIAAETEFVEMQPTMDTRSWDRANASQVEAAKRALRKKIGVQPQPTRSSEFEIPEQLAEYLYVNASNLVQFTDAGRVWLGRLQAATALALCLPRETFALSLIDQVAAYEKQAADLSKNIPCEAPRFFSGIWKANRRDELLELLPLLRYQHPELEDLPIEWIAGLLNASTMRGPEGTGNRADRRTYTAQERNKKKSQRKAQRNARKGNRR